MKICFIVGANNVFFERYCEYLISMEHDIHVIPLSDPVNPVSGAIYHDMGILKPRKPLSQFGFCINVRRYLRNHLNKPDMVSSFGINQCGWIGAFSGFRPFILHIMGSDLFISSAVKKKMGYFAIRKADHIISESQTIKNIVSTYRNSDKNNHVVQFGVRLDLFKPHLNVVKLRKELNLKDGFVIISPRNNHPIYNHDIVIKAFANVLKSERKCYLLLKAQDTDKKTELQKIARECGVLDNVKFFGFVPLDELPFYHNLADVCVSVPSSDSVPVTLQEAMACGVPPIVSDLPSVKEWVQNNVNGYVVPIRDVHALADAIIKLLNSEVKRDKFVAYNLTLVKEKSDYFENMRKLETIYKSCVKLGNLD